MKTEGVRFFDIKLASIQFVCYTQIRIIREKIMAMEKIVKIAPALSGRGDFCFGNLPGKWGVTSRYFTCGGRAVLPVTGEFHFSRYDRALWRTELEKIKAVCLN